MTEPDPIDAARSQLCDAIANFQTPLCDTLTVSPWVAMSLLQKAIRRGEERLALRAAATLLLSPDRLWRRCGCIAFEDVGVRSQYRRRCHGSSRGEAISGEPAAMACCEPHRVQNGARN